MARQVRRHGYLRGERLGELELENGKFKRPLAEAHLYIHALKIESLEEVRQVMTNWRADYNEIRPHSRVACNLRRIESTVNWRFNAKEYNRCRNKLILQTPDLWNLDCYGKRG